MAVINIKPQDSLGLKTVDDSTSIINDGQYFTANHYVSVGNATAVTVLITPPASSSSRYIFFNAAVQSNLSGVFTFSEAPNASGGSAITSINNYRDKKVSNPDPVVLGSTVTYVSSGTIIETILFSSSGSNLVNLGGNNPKHKYVLERGNLYLMRFVADAAATRVNFVLTYFYRDL
jgi:hypothetical protein